MSRSKTANKGSLRSWWRTFRTRFLSRFSIRMMLVLYTVLIVVPVFVLSIILSYFVQQNAENKEWEEAYEKINLVTASAQTRMDNLEVLSAVVCDNVNVVNFLSAPYEDSSSFFEYNDRIAPQFQLLQAASDISISDLTVYMCNDTIPEGYDIFRKISNLEQAQILMENADHTLGKWYVTAEPTPAIYYIRGIYSYYGETLLAVMVANVSFEIFLPGSQSSDTDVLLYQDNKLVFSSGYETQDFFLSELAQQQTYLTVSREFEPLGLQTVLRYPKPQGGMYFLWYIVLFFAFMLLSVGVYFVLLRRVVRDSEQMVRQVKRIVNDGFKGYDAEENRFEMSIFNEEYNSIVSQVRSLVQSGVEKNLLQRDAQIQAMQYQINPHMLCNSLNIIQYKCEAQEQYEISDMVAILGKIMRYSIDNASLVTDIRSEMTHLQSYIQFQRMRLGEDQLQFDLEVEERLMDTKIIRLLLQPLVENALIHGKLRNRPISVTVRIAQVEDHIRFQVINTGKQLTAEDIRGMESLLVQKQEQARDSIGLQNIHRRLTLFYGEDSGLKISVTDRGDTCIWFEVAAEGVGGATV